MFRDFLNTLAKNQLPRKGLTVGIVTVPQAMSYALLANLPAQYGLYTSFVGFLFYWAFATSKDITIGVRSSQLNGGHSWKMEANKLPQAVAVMSTMVGNVILKIQAEPEYKEFTADQIARGLALISGCILLFLGLARLGFVVEFIPLVGIASFMTGSAINICASQLAGMMGITGISTRGPTYQVIIDTLKDLPQAKLDAAMGLSALSLLYFIRWITGFIAKRKPQQQKLWFFISNLRMAFVVLLYVFISWLVNRGATDASEAKFEILGPVPKGKSRPLLICLT
jgi:solute carrier family 26 (sodium-independent sulfate anion transporter), member 11